MQKPYIKEKEGIILDVNDLFLNLTQFSKNELCGKYIAEVLDELFKCNNKITAIDEETEAALFTKAFDVRFVKIEKHVDLNNDINLYIFNEIENSRLDNKLLFVENLINDNKIGIGIYTAHDLKLVKANQKYLDFMPRPFNTKELIYESV